jgi:hypothetical protein
MLSLLWVLTGVFVTLWIVGVLRVIANRKPNAGIRSL